MTLLYPLRNGNRGHRPMTCIILASRSPSASLRITEHHLASPAALKIAHVSQDDLAGHAALAAADGAAGNPPSSVIGMAGAAGYPPPRAIGITGGQFARLLRAGCKPAGKYLNPTVG